MSSSDAPLAVRALSAEVDDAVALLQHGREQLRQLRVVSRTAPVVLCCLATGAEKLLKLSIGLVRYDEQQHWPSVAEMKAFGHDIVALDRHAQDLIHERADRSNSAPYLRRLQSAAAADPVLQDLLALLSRYARHGRFHNLDMLSGADTSLHPAPQQMWHDLELGLTLADPTLLRRLGSADQSDHDQARRTLNSELDGALSRWQTFYSRAWQHGVLGPTARTWSAALPAG